METGAFFFVYVGLVALMTAAIASVVSSWERSVCETRCAASPATFTTALEWCATGPRSGRSEAPAGYVTHPGDNLRRQRRWLRAGVAVTPAQVTEAGSRSQGRCTSAVHAFG